MVINSENVKAELIIIWSMLFKKGYFIYRNNILKLIDDSAMLLDKDAEVI